MTGRPLLRFKSNVIVRNLAEIEGTERDVDWGNGRSRRFLVESDGLGYSVTDTLVRAGSSSALQYRNHLESCYCVEGQGYVEMPDGERHSIGPGSLYALDKHEPHLLVAETDMRLLCVFSPALKGAERHELSDAGHSAY